MMGSTTNPEDRPTDPAAELHLPPWFDDFFEQAPVGVLLVDESGRILRANRLACTMFDRPPGVMVGEVFGFPLQGDEPVQLDVRRPNGEPGVALMTVAELTTEPPCHVAFLRDTTPMELLEERNQELEQFTYAASHDLREPLRTISSFLTLLETRHGEDLDEEAKEFVGFAVDAARRLEEMIRGLLAYSRVKREATDFVPVDLGEVLGEVEKDLRSLLDQVGADLRWDPDLPVVLGSRGQLRQVLENLVSNAVKFQVPGRPPHVHVSSTLEDGMVRVQVEDNGLGIPEADRERVFGFFQRLHTQDEVEGSGMGLALCRRIVEHHGGRMGVESEEGRGSNFWFTLPMAE